MAEPKAFLTYKRQNVGYRPIEERVLDFNELNLTFDSRSDTSTGEKMHGLRHTVLSWRRMSLAKLYP